MTNYPKSRQSSLVVQEMEAELLIYDLQINKAFCLNRTSAIIWQLCSGTNAVAEIAGLAGGKLKTKVPEELIWLALDQFKRDNLLEQNADFEIDFGNLSRREVIRKVGLGSMVALPLIASVVAPSALMAQSTRGNLQLNDPCTSESQCASGLFCSGSLLGGPRQCCISSQALVAPQRIVGCTATSEACDQRANQCCSNRVLVVPSVPGGDCSETTFRCFCSL